MEQTMSLKNLRWEDHPDNPLIGPEFPDWMIADPSVLTPDQTPDGRWHLFANAILRGIRHFVSDDGIHWNAVGKGLFTGIRPFVVRREGRYYLFYEKPASIRRSVIALRHSEDLLHWSPARTVLSPSLDWEGKGLVTNGNPCLIEHEGRFRLYFSAGWVFLPDCLFIEPLYIGVAEAEHIEGPYKKRHEPLIGPSDDPVWRRNMGAGSIKVLPPKPGALWQAFTNSIFRDEQGHSRSEIRLLRSTDGYHWEVASKEPMLRYEDSGWKRALVYAMHGVHYEGEWRMYYNARDGWFIGKERIGLAFGR